MSDDGVEVDEVGRTGVSMVCWGGCGQMVRVVDEVAKRVVCLVCEESYAIR